MERGGRREEGRRDGGVEKKEGGGKGGQIWGRGWNEEEGDKGRLD